MGGYARCIIAVCVEFLLCGCRSKAGAKFRKSMVIRVGQIQLVYTISCDTCDRPISSDDVAGTKSKFKCRYTCRQLKYKRHNMTYVPKYMPDKTNTNHKPDLKKKEAMDRVHHKPTIHL